MTSSTQPNQYDALLDQYADGKAASVWTNYIGSGCQRTAKYRDFFQKLLYHNDCSEVLDVACGTGVDSVMLLEQGFQVTSADFSDKMLKHTFQTRWERRHEAGFDEWEIYEANWLTLPLDIRRPDGGYDAVVCLGNSFAHLPDISGQQTEHKLALFNFWKMLKRGGILIIDHRNFDMMLDTGRTPSRNVYYNSDQMDSIKTSVTYTDGRPAQVRMDYTVQVPEELNTISLSANGTTNGVHHKETKKHEFTLTYYPHRLKSFTNLLKDVFGKDAEHRVYADFEELDKVKDPAFYVHVIQKL